MEEKIKYLNTDFSTAVGKAPAIEFKGRTLFVRFLDWRGEKIKMVFEAVVAFRWEEADETISDERNDCCYLIENSRWLALHLEQGKIKSPGQHKHYKFCFNTAGSLEVISTSMRTEI